MPRSPKIARISTYRPPTPFLNNMTSPPASPTLGASVSTDDHLDASYMLVNGEEDEESSTIGSSLRDSVIGDLLSESSEEPPAGHDGWDENTDGEQSDDEDNQPSPSITGRSYVDAEATATDVTSSMGTLQQSINSSQVRLIMPALEASGITTDSTTPGNSLGNLLTVPDNSHQAIPSVIRQRRRGSSPTGRGVEASWLEASSKLWNIPPELENMFTDVGEYKLMSSTDDVIHQASPEEGVERRSGSKAGNDDAGGQHKEQETVARQQLRRALAEADMVGRRIAKKWSVRMSVLALASVLSVAFLHSFGPGRAANLHSIVEDDASNRPEVKITTLPINTGKAFSLWNPLSASPSAAAIVTTDSSPRAPVATQRIPDLQLIKQALSTFSTISNKIPSGEPVITLSGSSNQIESSSQPRRKRREAMSSTICCSLSIRDSQVALTTVTTALSTMNVSRSMKWREKVMRNPVTAITNVTTPVPLCPCSVYQHVRAEMMSRLGLAFGPAAEYAVSASRYLEHIYAPAIAELRKELRELVALARSIAETTSTLSQIVINRAARGVSISRQALDATTARLRRKLPPGPAKRSRTEGTEVDIADHSMLQDAIYIARTNMENLSEHLEQQANALAALVEEQTTIMQEKSIDSLKQAKRGLNKLIAEVRKTTQDGDQGKLRQSNVGKEGPMPFTRMRNRAKRPALVRSSRQYQRQRSGQDERRPDRLFPPPEIPSRGRRFLDMVHHGAVALVLR